MTTSLLIWHLVGAWFVLVAIGAAWFNGYGCGKQVGELIGDDRMRKIYLSFTRRQDYGEQ